MKDYFWVLKCIEKIPGGDWEIGDFYCYSFRKKKASTLAVRRGLVYRRYWKAVKVKLVEVQERS